MSPPPKPQCKFSRPAMLNDLFCIPHGKISYTLIRPQSKGNSKSKNTFIYNSLLYRVHTHYTHNWSTIFLTVVPVFFLLTESESLNAASLCFNHKTAPSFILWWSKLEILFVPRHRNFYFIRGQKEYKKQSVIWDVCGL
jgi:hypothetical protein